MQTIKHTAIIKCECGKYVVSTRGGEFLYCECGKSFIDQERWSALYVRIGGNAEFIEQICPSYCELKNHDNKKFDDIKDLNKYLKKTYGYSNNKKRV